MARDLFINGETMVFVKGRSDSAISALTQFGLAADPVRIRLEFRHEDVNVDAWGGRIPMEVQWMLAEAQISMNLIHFDRSVMDVCLIESMGGNPGGTPGTLRRAGARLGNNAPQFAPGGEAGNHYISLQLSSPVAGVPWRFYFTYMTGPPIEFPLGTEKSIVQVNFRAIPYTQDPWGGGTGAEGTLLFDYGPLG